MALVWRVELYKTVWRLPPERGGGGPPESLQLVAPKKKGRTAPGKRELTNANQQERFLAAYAKTANVSLSASQARIIRDKHYDWLQNDPTYRPRFDIAHQRACDAVEGEIHRRAVKGVLEPVWYQGSKCGAVRKYDSTLLIFFAKGLMPQKYRDNFTANIEHTGKLAVNQTTLAVDLSHLTDEQYEQLKQMLGPRLQETGEPGLAGDPGSGGPEAGEEQD